MNVSTPGQRSFERAFRGLGGLAVQRLLERVDLVGAQNAFAQQAHLHLGERIAQGVGLALGGGAVELVVVGERVRVGPDARGRGRRPGRGPARQCSAAA